MASEALKLRIQFLTSLENGAVYTIHTNILSQLSVIDPKTELAVAVVAI